ncbi:methyl-accepting chemotaxis protein [Serpentinimonas barnesii]|uniref:methyl-accepting chemotaxis protein n=1 Tax=Serpentinimonas barnesii TaxID=1458427 RepID=UPI000AA7D263|nr:PAS domain-containing protein [Serpentinimonas barnesii]
MRNNQPVTQTEIVLRDGASIVSTTDLQGHITYCNAYFVEVSGFAPHELLGAPHNILRHPDMPPAAYADMWATLKGGLPWTGLVKNRTKKGDYYWVQANVTPVYERGQPAGYLSVRTKPARALVQQAEQAYQELRAGNPRRLRVQRGRVLTPTQQLLQRFDLQLQLKTATGLALGCMLLLGLQALGLLGGAGLGAALAAAGGASLVWAMWLMNQRVLAPLREITAQARILAGGDLTQSMPPAGEDPVGQL